MAKRLTDDEKRSIIKKLIESGKRDPAFYLSNLCNRFPEYSASTYSDWTKKLYGVAGGQYFTDAGAVMNEDQRIEYTRNILNSLKNRYVGKDPAPDYKTLKADNSDIDFYFIHLFAEYTGADYDELLIKNGCLRGTVPEETPENVENSKKEINLIDVQDFVIENGRLKEYTGQERNLVIPDGVERIDCRFYKNLALRKVIIPDSVFDGGYQTFMDCLYLREVKLSEKMDEIRRCMFKNTALESVVVPKKIERIENNAFADCKFLRKVIFLADYLEVNVSAFRNSPNVVIFCKKNMCHRLSLALNRPCHPLEDLGDDIAYYEDEAYMKAFPAGKPIEKASSFKVQVDGKDLTVRIKAESCLESEFNAKANRWYTFAEVFENYVSREEALEEYYREDPNCRSDGFLYVEPRLRDGASTIPSSEVEERVCFLKSVYRGLNNQEAAQKLAEYAPKKKNGFFYAAVYTRIACAGIANKDLKIPEIVAKAKDEKTLEVYVKSMEYTLEEVGKLNTGFLTSFSDKSGSEPILTEKKPAGLAGESIMSEIRYGSFTFPITLFQDADGEFKHKACGRSLESFSFVEGTPKSGYDIHIEDNLHDNVISQGISFSVSIDIHVNNSLSELARLYEYYHSKRDNKDFESFKASFNSFSWWAKSDLDNVVDSDDRIEACVIATLCCWEVAMKNFARYAQAIADDRIQKEKVCAEEYKQKKRGFRSGKPKLPMGCLHLTKDTCELYSGAEPYLPQYCGMELFICYDSFLGDCEVRGFVGCDPRWA